MGGGLPDVVRHATGGRHYCFAVVSFRESFAFFERIRAIVASETGFACIRADDVHGTGEDLREKIHDAIRAAEFVVADISQASPNIFYEVGYSVASGKRLLLLAREKVAIPTDLRGVEVIRYEDTVAGWTQLEKSLRGFLSEMCRRRDTALLRAMMMPAAPGPAFILANPRHGRPGAVFYTRQRRTWGDNLGIVGILSAYGSVYGETVVPELIGTSNAADDLLETDANYYLIGSAGRQPPRGFRSDLARPESLAPGTDDDGAGGHAQPRHGGGLPCGYPVHLDPARRGAASRRRRPCCARPDPLGSGQGNFEQGASSSRPGRGRGCGCRPMRIGGAAACFHRSTSKPQPAARWHSLTETKRPRTGRPGPDGTRVLS